MSKRSTGRLSVERIYQEARELNPKVPDWALRRAAPRVASEAFGTESLLELAARCVRRAQDYVEVREGSQESARPILRITPYSRVTAQEIVRMITPAVARVRLMYFGRKEPPFAPDEYAEAVEWIKRKNSEYWLSLTDELIKRRERLMGELVKLADDFERLTGEFAEVRFDYPATCHYELADGSVRELYTTRRHPLFAFALVVSSSARLTGALEPEIVRHILCGVEPRFYRAIIRLHREIGQVLFPNQGIGDYIRREEVVVTFRSPEISREELSAVFQHIVAAWRSTRAGGLTGRFTEKDELLYRLMVELGGAHRAQQPRGYWKAVRERWEELTGESVTDKALILRWREVKKKISSHPVASPTTNHSARDTRE